jgi:hypothetical protein
MISGGQSLALVASSFSSYSNKVAFLSTLLFIGLASVLFHTIHPVQMQLWFGIMTVTTVLFSVLARYLVRLNRRLSEHQKDRTGSLALRIVCLILQAQYICHSLLPPSAPVYYDLLRFDGSGVRHNLNMNMLPVARYFEHNSFGWLMEALQFVDVRE